MVQFLVSNLSKTQWGKSFNLPENCDYNAFQNTIPLQTYDTLKPFIEQAIKGESDVLWKGKTMWFAKSSGTTSDRSKLIPVTEESLFENHYKSGKDLLANYYEIFENAQLFREEP